MRAFYCFRQRATRTPRPIVRSFSSQRLDELADRGTLDLLEDEVVVREEVGLVLAQRIVNGVRAEAERRRLSVGAAVVDAGGQVVAAIRMDGAQLSSLPIAVDKAYTAVAIGLP